MTLPPSLSKYSRPWLVELLRTAHAYRARIITDQVAAADPAARARLQQQLDRTDTAIRNLTAEIERRDAAPTTPE